MIKINLLPTEKRKAERTPRGRFVLILVTVAAASLLAVYIVGVNVAIKQVENQIAEAKAQLQALQPSVREFEQLTTQKQQLSAKVTEIKGLIGRDVEWWRAINALWDVIHANPKVWIDDIRTFDERSVGGEAKRINPDAKGGEPYGVSMKCHVAGDEVSEMTRFRRDLKNHPILQETLTTVNFNPDWRIEDETAFEEKHSISFQISMFGPTAPLVRKAQRPPQPGTEAPGAAPAPGMPPGGTPR